MTEQSPNDTLRRLVTASGGPRAFSRAFSYRTSVSVQTVYSWLAGTARPNADAMREMERRLRKIEQPTPTEETNNA